MYQGRIASSPVCCNPGRFLDKRRFTRINLRKQHAFRYPTSDGSREAAGGPALPSIFRLKPESETEARNWGPKGGKKIFGGNRLPSSSNLSKGLDDRPPPLHSPSLSQGLDPALPTTDFPATSEERAEKFPRLMTSH